MRRVKSRTELIRKLAAGGIGAELGVFDGAFSQQILTEANPRRLYLVDLWIESTEMKREDGSESLKTVALTGAQAWQIAHERLREAIKAGQVQLVCAEACAWLEAMPAASLDWVYLDDNHGFDHVNQELQLAWHCVRKGGWIMGHDYCEVLPDVARAVNSFCSARGVKIEYLTDEQQLPVHPRYPGMPATCSYNSYAILVR